MAETIYADDYEFITGKKILAKAETKVVTPPEDTPIFAVTEAETKGK